MAFFGIRRRPHQLRTDSTWPYNTKQGRPEGGVGIMASPLPSLVPKVHPTSRPVEPDDPLTLHATTVAGDPELMLHCLVQEYAWMGWDAEQILSLFRDPFYPVLHGLWCLYG